MSARSYTTCCGWPRPQAAFGPADQLTAVLLGRLVARHTTDCTSAAVQRRRAGAPTPPPYPRVPTRFLPLGYRRNRRDRLTAGAQPPGGRAPRVPCAHARMCSTAAGTELQKIKIRESPPWHAHPGRARHRQAGNVRRADGDARRIVAHLGGEAAGASAGHPPQPLEPPERSKRQADEGGLSGRTPLPIAAPLYLY